MKRRTIDLVASAGGLVLALILLVGGLVFTSNASFAKNYVHDQLLQQQISFPALDEMSDEEKAEACLVQYAGQQLTTGKQSECFANHYIGLHLRNGGNGPLQGLTYSQIGDYSGELTAQRNALNAQIEALPADDPTLAALTAQRDDLNTQITAANARRETVFKGESLRGMLLTSYGFSELGAKAELGATVAYVGSGLMFVLAFLGFWHGYRTPPTEAFAAPATEARRRERIEA